MTIKEMQKILEKAIKDGKGDYKVVVEWRDGGGRLRWDTVIIQNLFSCFSLTNSLGLWRSFRYPGSIPDITCLQAHGSFVQARVFLCPD